MSGTISWRLQSFIDSMAPSILLPWQNTVLFRCYCDSWDGLFAFLYTSQDGVNKSYKKCKMMSQKAHKRSVCQILQFRTLRELVTCISATMFSSGFRWTVKASLISLTPSKRTSISTKCCVSPSLNSISENMRQLKINPLFVTSCDSRPSHERWQLMLTFQFTDACKFNQFDATNNNNE